MSPRDTRGDKQRLEIGNRARLDFNSDNKGMNGNGKNFNDKAKELSASLNAEISKKENGNSSILEIDESSLYISPEQLGIKTLTKNVKPIKEEIEDEDEMDFLLPEEFESKNLEIKEDKTPLSLELGIKPIKKTKKEEDEKEIEFLMPEDFESMLKPQEDEEEEETGRGGLRFISPEDFTQRTFERRQKEEEKKERELEKISQDFLINPDELVENISTKKLNFKDIKDVLSPMDQLIHEKVQEELTGIGKISTKKLNFKDIKDVLDPMEQLIHEKVEEVLHPDQEEETIEGLTLTASPPPRVKEPETTSYGLKMTPDDMHGEEEDSSSRETEDISGLGFDGLLSPEEMQAEEQEMEDDSSNALSPETIIYEKYKILKIIQAKYDRSTYLVKDIKVTDKKFIIKEIIPPRMSMEQFRARREKFMDTIRVLSTFKHPNLAEVYEGFIENNRLYCVMEYVEGLDLHKLSDMNVNPFSEKEVLKWGLVICDALEFMHYRPQPFTLGELSPGHIIVDGHGDLKIINYDLRRFFNPSRTLEFMHDNPEKLFEDIAKVSRILYFLLTKKSFEGTGGDMSFPKDISPKMQRLLQVTSYFTQQTVGSIKDFRKKLEDTQIPEVVENTEEIAKKRRRRFFRKEWYVETFQKISGLIMSQKPYMLGTEGVFILFLIFYGIFSHIQFKSRIYSRPWGQPLVYVSTRDSLFTLEKKNPQIILDSRPLKPGLTDLYGLTLKMKIRQEGKNIQEKKQVLIGGDRGSIKILDKENNLPLSEIRIGGDVDLIVPSQYGNKIFALQSSTGSISVVDLDALKVENVFMTGMNPRSLIFIPRTAGLIDRTEKITGENKTPEETTEENPDEEEFMTGENEEEKNDANRESPDLPGSPPMGKTGTPATTIEENGTPPTTIEETGTPPTTMEETGTPPTTMEGTAPDKDKISPSTEKIRGSYPSMLVVSNSQSRNLIFMNAKNGRPLGRIKIKGIPGKMVASKDYRFIYLIDEENQSLLIVDVENKSVIREMKNPGGKGPSDIVLEPKYNRLWILFREDNKLISYDIDNEEFSEPYFVFKEPYRMFLDKSDGRLWILNRDTKDVTVFNTMSGQVEQKVLLGTVPTALLIED